MSIISHKNLQFNKDWAVNKPNSSSSARITTCFIFICLINKSSSDSSLSLTTKRVKLKYNNLYIYKTGAFEACTIFHVRTILKKKKNKIQKKKK